MGLFKKNRKQPIELDQINLKKLSNLLEEVLVLIEDTNEKKRVFKIQDDIKYAEPSTKIDIKKYESRIEDAILDLKKCYLKDKKNKEELISQLELLVIERANNR